MGFACQRRWDFRFRERFGDGRWQVTGAGAMVAAGRLATNERQQSGKRATGWVRKALVATPRHTESMPCHVDSAGGAVGSDGYAS
jgi:hypothetical protein